MKGRIIKGIGGFYYVYAEDENVYTCKARGVFRKDRIKPLVGDYVVIEKIPSEEFTANIVSLQERKNELIRPNVANVDQALIIFALKDPEPNFITLDKMILEYSHQDIPVILCFNKEDLIENDKINKVIQDYSGSGCRIYTTCASNNEGIDELYSALLGSTSVVCGPSGAGKSTIVNCLNDSVVMETGDISRKLARGKHTTRHSEIIPIGENTYIVDTPGFSSFDLYDLDEMEIAGLYCEFDGLSGCRFIPCSHTHEPDCSIKEAVLDGRISQMRYDNYVYIYEEVRKHSKIASRRVK